VAAIPALISLWLVAFHLGADPYDYAPQWSDEIYNWHQVATFRAAGFQGGYYTVEEEPAPFSFSHFYTHGPFYPALFGTLGRLTGWRLDSAPVMGVALTTLALFFFIFWTKMDRAQLLVLGLAVLTFWPMHLYMATDMRLSFFDVIAIVLAASFYRTITDPDGASPPIPCPLRRTDLRSKCVIITWKYRPTSSANHTNPWLHLRVRSRLRSQACSLKSDTEFRSRCRTSSSFCTASCG